MAWKKSDIPFDINNVKANRYRIEQTIADLQFFTTPFFNFCNNKRYRGSTSWHQYLGKVEDCTLISVIRKSIVDFKQALLPLGVKSAMINYRQQIMSKGLQLDPENIRLIEKQATNFLQLQLEKHIENFDDVMYRVVEDYIKYGNAAVLNYSTDKKFRLTHLPFEYCYYYFLENEGLQGLVFERLVSDGDLEAKNLKKKTDEAKESTQDTLLTTVFWKQGDKWLSGEYLSTEDDSDLTNVIVYPKPPINVARMGQIESGDIYGYGDGLAAVTFAARLNRLSDRFSILTEKAADPPVIIPSGMQCSLTHSMYDTVYGYDDQNNTIGLKAGDVTQITRTDDLLNDGGNQITYLEPQKSNVPELILQEMQMDRDNMSKLFFSDRMLDNITRTSITAEEIRARLEQAIKEFNGKAAPIYSQIMQPLFQNILSKINLGKNLQTELATVVKNANLDLNDYLIEFYNFAKEKRQMMQQKAIAEKIQLLTSLKPEQMQNIPTDLLTDFLQISDRN